MALEPLKISCTDTDCDNDLHCFLQKERRRSATSVARAGLAVRI